MHAYTILKKKCGYSSIEYVVSNFCLLLLCASNGECNLSAWSRKYVEVDGFVEKRPLAGSSGEKTRSCDFGRYFIHFIATNSSFLTCSAMFLWLPVVKGGY